MSNQEMESLVKQLKAAGLTEDQIMETFFETFQEGKMDRKDLESLAEFMGYELTDNFKADATPDPIAGGEGEGEGGVTASEVEQLKEIKPGESKEEFKEKVEEAKEGGEVKQPEGEGGEPAAKEPEAQKSEEVKSEEKVEETNSEGKAEDKEWEEVQKKFHW